MFKSVKNIENRLNVLYIFFIERTLFDMSENYSVGEYLVR